MCIRDSLVPFDDTMEAISDHNVPDEQTLLSEAKDQVLPNNDCVNSAFTVDVATTDHDEETSQHLEMSSLGVPITEAMPCSEIASNSSTTLLGSCRRRDPEATTVSSNERAAPSFSETAPSMEEMPLYM